MVQKLKLRLFGQPTILFEGKDITEALPGKGQAILFYLAISGRRQTRSVLAGLLWGDQPEDKARANLRKAISSLRRYLGPLLNIDRQSIAFDPQADYWVDVTAFEKQLKVATLEGLQAAIELYTADFLKGFEVRGAADFDTWLVAEQSRLSEAMVHALQDLAMHHAAHSRWEEAIHLARRLLSIEPWHEETHRLLMHWLAQDGQRSVALAQFETCRQILAEELDVPPSAETIDLYERIRQGDFDPKPQFYSTISIEPASTTPPLHNLPKPSTPFIGRQAEIADIVSRLEQPDCRLLTLVGPGGIGKTRLATQVAQTLADQPIQTSSFKHGITFVPLAPVTSVSGTISAIAQATGFDFYSNVPPQQQLLDYLREKQMLLVLDNFEHLLAAESTEQDNVDLVANILAVASAVKILLTSREAIHLVEAWFHPVGGLSFPATASGNGSTALEAYDAVQLFVQSARRARVDFSLNTEQAHIVRICQLVGGMPLAIEMAAAWLRILPTNKIVQEIESGLDILSTRVHNVPERHRSIRAVFEQSWQLLSPEEQAVLRQLTVFRGGFRREAARQVAGASLPLLAALIEKSLLRPTADGRYYLHELLQQFATEKFENPATEATVRTRHSVYYLNFLQAREGYLKGEKQQVALAEISADIDNIRLGWQWAVEQADFVVIDQALNSLYEFYQIRGRFQEGRELLAQMLTYLQAANPRPDSLLVRVLARQGGFCHFLGDDEAAETYLQDGLSGAQRLDLSTEAAFALNILGQMAGWQAKKSLALTWLQQSLDLSRAAGDQDTLANTLHKLAQIQASFGDYGQAKKVAEESLAISRRLGRPDWRGYALDVLGWATVCLGHYTETEAYYRESLALFEDIGHQLGIALALGGLGSVAWAVGGERLNEAQRYIEQSLAICREVGHRHHVSSRLWYLAQIANDRGDYRAAQAYAKDGLTIAREIGSPVFMAYNLGALGEATGHLNNFSAAGAYLHEALQMALAAGQLPPLTIALLHFAGLLVRAEDKTLALQVLIVVCQEPACWQVFRERARRLQNQLESELSTEAVATVRAQGRGQSLEVVVSRLLDMFSKPTMRNS